MRKQQLKTFFLALAVCTLALLAPMAHSVQYQIVYVPATVVINGKPVVIRRPVVRPWAVPTNRCGMSAPAFCDTFDRPATVRGRAGELDVNKWSGARMQPEAGVGSGTVRHHGGHDASLPCRSADDGISGSRHRDLQPDSQHQEQSFDGCGGGTTLRAEFLSHSPAIRFRGPHRSYRR
ncbi:MAG: hypothetical protein U1F34_05355 [Gammaproteobacteria bacterium]